MVSASQLALRSLDATWNRARWEELPDDGNCYEVIGGVPYMATAPRFFHPTEEYGMVRGRRVEGVHAPLVEVLSPGTPETDTQIKRVAYTRAGGPESWTIRPATRDAAVYSRQDAALGDDAQSTPVKADGELISPALPVRFMIADLFAGALDTTL